MSEGAEGQQKVSKFNSASAQNIRVDGLWQKAHTYSSSGNYQLWNATLDKIWSELAGDLEEDSPEIAKFNKFIEKLGASGSLTKGEIKGFKTVENPSKANQYLTLLNKEIWLRRLQNSQGKGTAYADEFEDEFD